MDVTCTAINLIYLIICFLPFYVIVSFHFSLLFPYIFFLFSPLLLCLFSPSCNAYVLSSSSFGFPPSTSYLLAFRLYLTSDPPFHVIWLCLSSFSVALQYLIGKLVRLLRYLLLLKFSSS